MTGPSHRVRQYGYGEIKKAIVAVLADGKIRTAQEVIDAVERIDHKTAWRNLRALCATGIIVNVGTHRKALYKLPIGERT